MHSWQHLGLVTIWFAAIIVARFHDLMGAFWRNDDPALLNHALQSPGLSVYFDSEAWRKLSPSNLTPWVTVSLKVDLALFGLDPVGFYAHQLLTALILCITSFFLLRRFTSERWAILALTLFLLGAPTGAVVDTLTTRHYLEGLLAAVFAFEAFIQATTNNKQSLRNTWLVVSLLSYGVAASAKEIYVPLPLLFLTHLGRLEWRRSLNAILPFLVLLGIYVIWRKTMLGTLVGGYTPTNTLFSATVITDFVSALKRFPTFFWGHGWPVASCIVALVAIRCLRFWSWKLIPLVTGVLLPLLPLTVYPGLNGPDRYLLLPWFVLCTLFAVALPRLLPDNIFRVPIAVIASLGLILPTLLQEIEQRSARLNVLQNIEVQGRFLWTASRDEFYIPSDSLASGFWYAVELCALRVRERDNCPKALLQGIDEVPFEQPVLRLYEAAMRPMSTEDVVGWLQVDRKRPLWAEVDLRSDVISWRFGPYQNGQYFVASRELGRFPISRLGSLRFSPRSNFEFSLLHQNDKGEVTASPLLNVTTHERLRWDR